MLQGVFAFYEVSLELPKNNVVFGNMGEVKNGILYIYRLNSFYDLMYEIAYAVYGTDKCWYCGKPCRRGKGRANRFVNLGI